MRCSPADRLVVAAKPLLAGVAVEPRGRLIRTVHFDQPGLSALGGSEENMPASQVKPLDIPKQLVWEAYRRVAANKGAPGVDQVTLGEFEADLKDNLYKIWNRMSSGTYFPPPGAGGGNTETPWWGDQDARGTYDRRSRCANGGGHVLGRAGGTEVPSRFLWLPSVQGSVGCGRGVPAAMLEVRLGHRPRCPEVL